MKKISIHFDFGDSSQEVIKDFVDWMLNEGFDQFNEHQYIKKDEGCVLTEITYNNINQKDYLYLQ